MIKENVLVPSKPTSFNDPFDVYPTIVDDLSDADILEFLNSQFGIKFAQVYGSSVKELKNSFDKCRQLLRSTILSVRDASDVLCFSKNLVSPLLWAHYANGYKGACLFFVPDARTILFNNTLEVIYSNQRPILPMSLIVRRARHPRESHEFKQSESDIVRLFFGQKSADWSYEQEIRAAAVPEKNWSWKILNNELRAIIFGPLTHADTIGRIRQTLAASNKNIRLVQARLSDSEYSMAVDWTKVIN